MGPVRKCVCIQKPIVFGTNFHHGRFLFVCVCVSNREANIEVRDSPHGIFGSCTRYPRGLTRWAELLGRRRRRRRRQLVLPGGYRPPDPPPCLISKEQVLAEMVQEPKRSDPMVQMGRKSTGSSPSVFPDSQVIPECLVLQYFQIHRSSECLVL